MSRLGSLGRQLVLPDKRLILSVTRLRKQPKPMRDSCVCCEASGSMAWRNNFGRVCAAALNKTLIWPNITQARAQPKGQRTKQESAG
jgi:hypothetical protein